MVDDLTQNTQISQPIQSANGSYEIPASKDRNVVNNATHAEPAPSNPNTTNTSNTVSALNNLEPNIASTLSYLVPPFTGIAIYVTEKQNKFVRFHALQSAMFGIVCYGAWAIAQTLKPILIGYPLSIIVSLSGFVFWIFLMWKAYKNEEYLLPYLGKLAKEHVYK